MWLSETPAAGRRAKLDAVFAALSDPTRRAMIARLARSDATMSELARPFSVSLPAIAKHVGVLARAGLVVHRKQGRERLCRLAIAPLRSAADWIASYRLFWQQRLDGLAAHFSARSKA